MPEVARASSQAAIHFAPVFIEPIVAAEVAAALADLTQGAARHDILEIGGPERFRLDEFRRRLMEAMEDPRDVVTDPLARDYGAMLTASR
jgi:uncharacterized protein YbjT (DUF2867 family)